MIGVCLIGLFAFVGLAVDLGILALARTQSQNAADDAALVGVRNLNNKLGVTDTNRANAIAAAQTAVTGNTLLNTAFTSAQLVNGTPKAGLYSYDSANGYFSVSYPSSLSGGQSWTAMNVQLASAQPTFFMRVMGVNSMPTGANATAVHRPRDVAVVLDFSASMRFGSLASWEEGYGGATGEVRGYMNPDPRYPQFGHYARYTRYQTTSLPDYGPSGGTQVATPSAFCTQATVGNRPNPLCTQVVYVMQTGEIATPNNHTMDSPNGPPVLTGVAQASGSGWSGGFWYDPSNPAQNGANAANLQNAFYQWTPTITVAGNPDTYVPNQYDWSAYPCTPSALSAAALPAPDFFKDQTSSGSVSYLGDMWPKTDGTEGGPFTETSSTRTAAATLAEFLGVGTFASGASPPQTTPANAAVSGSTWDSYRNKTWETYGYDLQVKAWRNASPAYPTPSGWTDKTYVQQTAANKFQGYSMGPMYWGKTFFVWPPDPRFSTSANLTSPSSTQLSYDTSGNPMCDWRRRFFLKASGSAPFNPPSDGTGGTDNINKLMFNNAAGATLASGAQLKSSVVPNYPAILAWIKSGPQVFPPNLRAGRILFYTSIPSTVANASTNMDQLFWKNYIDFVLGLGSTGGGKFDPRYELAGVEYAPWPEGATVGVSQWTTPPSVVAGTANPNPGAVLPYMNYTDNPSRPRMHFWFGPATMLCFLSSRTGGWNWLPGTVHEAQDWQLKAGIDSALDDIRSNHPNDQIGSAYFANFAWTTIRCPMGQDYTSAKNALFFPNSIANKITGGDKTTELLPYNSSLGSPLVGDLPNANGGTDPVTGLVLAYNLLSSGATHSTLVPPWSAASTAAATGRTGAQKIVIFETDGVPNAPITSSPTPQWSFYRKKSGTGVNQSYFQNDNSGTYNIALTGPFSGSPSFDGAANAALQAVNQIVAPTTAANPGYSLPSAKARVFGLAYGDLFYYNTPRKTYGLNFLYNLQVAGGTQAADGSNTVPSYQIITGPYQTRIDNIRTAMQTIMQSGVQVALIE